MKKLLSTALATLLIGSILIPYQNSVLALEKNRISASEAQGKIEGGAILKVGSYGLVLSFEEMGESISKYWATDDAFLRVGTNAPIGQDPTILFLKTEGQWPTSNDGTTLTVMTKNKSGKSRIYSFFIEFTKEKPKYPIVRISPDDLPKRDLATKIQTDDTSKSNVVDTKDQKNSDKRLPVAGTGTLSTPVPPLLSKPQPQKALASIVQSITPIASSQPLQEPASKSSKDTETSKLNTSTLNKPEKIDGASDVSPNSKSNTSEESIKPVVKTTSTALVNHAQANALIRGLAIATQKKEIKSNSKTTFQLQNVVRRLRRGEKLTEASKQESVKWETITHLLKLGNYRGEL